MPQNNWTKAGG